MSHPFGRLLPGLVFCFISSFVSAQEISAYSRYGLGNVQSGDFSASKAMGSLSAAYRNPLQVNYSNPASYTALSLTTLEGGFSFSTATLNYNGTSAKTGDGYIDYYSLSVPVGKRLGLSFGLAPYSKMNYSFSDSANDASAGPYNRLFSGSGRLYNVYIGAGYRVIGSDTSKQSLSLGVNANVLFGELNYTESLSFPDSTYSLATQKIVSDHVTDFVFDVGFQWVIRFNKHDSTFYNHHRADTRMTIGGYAQLPTNRASLVDATFDRYDSLTATIIDTLSYSYSSKIKQNIPPKFGGGVTFNNGYKWMVGADASYTLWSKFVDVGNSTINYRNDFRVSLGAEFRPSAEGNGFFKHTFYRVGGYYDGGYLTINGQNISEYGLTFGFGIPMKSENKGGIISVPYLNLFFSGGSRGTTAANLVQERFFTGTISFTLNSKWFIKPQYE